MANYASGRHFNIRERWLLNAAVNDPMTATTIHAILHGEVRAETIIQAYSVLRIGTSNAQGVARRTGQIIDHFTT